jgi:hypothetical protein
MTTNFRFNNGGTITDFDDAFISNDLFVNGGLWLWGLNTGDNTVTNRSSPVQTISSGTNWKSVVDGITSTNACIKTDGTLWLWGEGSSGQLGNNATTSRSSPVQTISTGTNWKQVSGAGSHTASIKTDGTLWLWGDGANGRLGNNATTNRSSPVQTISTGADWKQVACGGGGHTACIKTNGTLWMWGVGGSGQLGDNTAVGKSSPVQTISATTDWKQVSCGSSHTACIKTDGTLWLWGLNTNGQLGDNTATSRSSPVQTIGAATNWKQVSCGEFHTSAIKTDGTLWLWGFNDYGQLGDNTITNKSSPVQTVSTGANWKQACGGARFSAAIKTDGTLWTWGSGFQGRLGDNTAIRKSSPVQTVAGGTNWIEANAGFGVIAIRSPFQ